MGQVLIVVVVVIILVVVVVVVAVVVVVQVCGDVQVGKGCREGGLIVSGLRL